MKKILFLMLTVCTVFATNAQTKVGGVSLPNTVTYGGEQWILNGAGVREKFWMDMYAGALYLKQKNNNATAILSNNQPTAIKLHILSGMITSDKMIDAVNEGFQNSTGGNTSSLQAEINKFKGFFKEKINKNDVFDMVYLPSEGVDVYKNGKKLGNIQGEAFKKAMFGIWLSNKPADDDLKESMLGK